MYTIFVDNSRIILTCKSDITLQEGEAFYPIKKINLDKLIRKLCKKKLDTIYLFHHNKKKLLKKFKSKISVVIAAGGLVKNEENELLFIYRNKKWDLPKGKLDTKKEPLESAAMREVEEETSVKNLRVESFITVTYHLFKSNNSYKLKETHWFFMSTSFKGVPVPQKEEGITKARWKKPKQVSKLLSNSYPNIKLIFAQLEQFY